MRVWCLPGGASRPAPAQTFSSNMSSKTAPKITPCKHSDNWTCITFEPDLAKFDMTVRVLGVWLCH